MTVQAAAPTNAEATALTTPPIIGPPTCLASAFAYALFLGVATTLASCSTRCEVSARQLTPRSRKHFSTVALCWSGT